MGKGEGTSEKRVMPELLPAPTVVGPGGPRQRTLRNMNRLLAMAAAGATLAACAQAPTERDAVAADPAPTSTPKTPPTPPTTAPTAQGGPTGYAVVDPMPAPARCAGLAQTVQATATWKSDSVIVVHLPKPGMANASYLSGEAPNVWNGTLANKTVAADQVTLEIQLLAALTAPGASIAASCPQGTQHLSVLVTGPGEGAIQKGGPLTVLLSDSW